MGSRRRRHSGRRCTTRSTGRGRASLDLDHGTVRFRQELTIVEVDVLPGGVAGADGTRKEPAVGPMKSKASKAILSLPAFAVRALRHHRQQRARPRLAGVLPATVQLRWVEPGQPPRPRELDLVFRTERGTVLNPNHASRGFAELAKGVGLVAHPTCSAMRLPRRWRPTRNRYPSSPRSCATPTAARSPSGSRSTSSRRPHQGWPG